MLRFLPAGGAHRVARLGRGRTVEIDGLGIFYPDAATRFPLRTAGAATGLYRVRTGRRRSGSTGSVEDLNRAGLATHGLISESCLPGKTGRAPSRQRSRARISSCRVSREVGPQKGRFQSEIRYALDCARQVPLDRSTLCRFAWTIASCREPFNTNSSTSTCFPIGIADGALLTMLRLEAERRRPAPGLSREVRESAPVTQCLLVDSQSCGSEARDSDPAVVLRCPHIYAAIFLVYAETRAFTFDEAYHLLTSQLIVAGRTPYIDFCFPQTPLNAYWNAAWMRVLGESWHVPHFFAALFIIGAAGLIADYVRRRFPVREWRTPGAIAAMMAIGLNGAVFEYGPVQAYGICLFGVVAGFRWAVRAVDREIGFVLERRGCAPAWLRHRPCSPRPLLRCY